MGAAVTVATFTLAAAIVALYVWFFVRRYRAEQRAKTDVDTTGVATPPLSARTAPSAPPAPLAPAAPPSSAPDTADPSPRVPTVAEALSGIRLPCDLVPLTNIVARPDVVDRVAFATTSYAAEEVGSALADELERLGYTIVPLGEDRIRAEKPGAHVALAIHPTPASVIVGSVAAFPTAPADSVVVEAWV